MSAEERSKPLPAEQRRLGSALFREGLKKRGLTELLALHMKDFPPESPVATLLMRREVKLSESTNPSLRASTRRQSLVEANELLFQVIEASPGDARRFDWLLSLGRSLLFEEAAPYVSTMLYVGGNAQDRTSLRSITARAMKVIEDLDRQLGVENDRIDKMSAQEFEAIQAGGILETLDRVSPRADYLRIWGLFYDALSRTEDDPRRGNELSEIVSLLASKSAILRTSQDQNPVQIPMLLVAAMAQRRLGDHARARELFDRARSAYQRITVARQKRQLHRIATLVEIESVRNDRDDGRFRAARIALDRLAKLIDPSLQPTGVDPFFLRTAHALLARSLSLSQAAFAAHLGRTKESREQGAAAWKPLAQLALSVPDRRSELYATVYRQIKDGVIFSSLDAFEKVALIEGLVADQKPDRALELAQVFLDAAGPSEQILVPDVLYQVGLVHYERNENAEAALSFLQIAREYDTWTDALRAGELAVKLSYKVYHAADASMRSSARARYELAMRTLLEKFPGSAQSNYWRFFYGQILLEQEKAKECAELLADVAPDHPHYLDALSLRVRAIERRLETEANLDEVGSQLDKTVAELLNSYQRLVAHCDDLQEQGSDAPGLEALNAFRAEGLITTCEGLILPGVGRYQRSVEMLTGFEKRYPAQHALRGRLWRVRLLAYEALGQLEQVARSIPQYVESDGSGAGATLESLYEATIGEYHRLRDRGDDVSAKKKAMTALTLAQQLSQWEKSTDIVVAPARKRLIALRLAEANLFAGEVDRANELFGLLAPDDRITSGEMTDLDARTLWGKAESLRRRGEYDRALVIFNRLATGLSPELPLRWESLLGDLQCRTAQLQAPGGIVRVIEQQRFLYPRMGGPTLAARFDRLLRENENRAIQAEQGVP